MPMNTNGFYRFLLILVFLLDIDFSIHAQWNSPLLGDSLLKLIESQPSDSQRIRFINGLGVAFSNQSQFQKADTLFEHSLRMSEQTGMERDLASTLQNIGIHKRNQGKLNESINYLLRSLKLKEDLGMHPKNIAGSCNVIGTVYASISDYTRAERYLSRATSIYESLGDTLNPSYPLINLSVLYAKTKRHAKAIECMQRALQLFGDKLPTQNVGVLYSNMATSYYETGQYKEALKYADKTQEYADKVNIPMLKSGALMIRSKCQLAFGDTTQAKKLAKESLQLSKKYDDAEGIKDALAHLATIDSLEGSYRDAQKKLEEKQRLEDSLRAVATPQVVEQISGNYELRDTLRQTRKEVIQVRRTNYYILVVSGLLLIILVLAYFMYKRKRKLELVMKLEQTRNAISRDLHDDIGSSLSSITRFSEALQNTADDQESVKNLSKKIQNISSDMNAKMSDIVWSLNTEDESTEPLLERLQNYCALTLAPIDVDYDIQFSEASTQVKISPHVMKDIYLILKEAINNSLKHSGASLIQVHALVSNQQLCLTVQDNGRGFAQHHLPTLGGKGLESMQQRALKIQGVFSMESEPQKGCRVSICVPLPN